MRNNMASDNHPILSLFTSSNPLMVFLKMLPLIIAYFLVLFSCTSLTWMNIVFFFIGIITWSLFEYAVHRWLYHIPIKNKKIAWYIDAFHLHHHKNLKDYRVLNAGFLVSYPLTLFFLGIVYLFTSNIGVTVSFGLGMTIYYMFYEFVHYQIHYKIQEGKYLKFVQDYHLYHHHKKWSKNYGNTTSLWDKVFGTYDKGFKTFKLNETQKANLIVNKS